MDDRRDGNEEQERQAGVSGEPTSSTTSSTHNLRNDTSVPRLSKLSPPTSRHQSTLSPGTPSTRTGPPASLNFSLNRRRDSYFQERHESMDPSWMIPPSQTRPTLQQVDTEFRSALEYAAPEQREAEREMMEKRERKRLSRIQGEDYWKPLRWFAESPKDDGSDTDLPRRSNPPTRQHSAHDGFATPGPSRLQTVESVPGQDQMPDNDATSTAPGAPPRIVKRSSSLPQLRKSTASRPSGAPARWTRLKSLLPNIANASASVPSNAVVHHSVNITDELIAGGLSTLMLQLWFDRDERGHRRIPILLHRLRVRISDSLYPMSGNKAVFRIECEYANGAARWVIYRQLRDFVSLHTHYTVSNAYNRLQDHIPEFPRTSTLPLDGRLSILTSLQVYRTSNS
jgi:phospholipase D1/2